MRYPSTIDSDFDAERSENDQGSSESPFGNHLERNTPMLAGMTQTTNIRSVWLPGEINGSRKDSPTAPVTYHPDRITSPFRVVQDVVTCVQRYINGAKKRSRICARRHLRGLTSHTYVVGWPGFIWGTCRGNTPRSFSGKNSGNCISTGVVDEAQSPVCTWQSRRGTSHAAGKQTDTLCLYIVVYLDAVLTLYSCYLRTW